jgi:hypothetical protein
MALLKSIVSRTGSAAAARSSEVFHYFLAGLWLLSALAGTLYLLNRIDLGRAGVVLLPALGILLAASGATLFSSLAELYGQRARDIGAAAIFETLKRGARPRQYALYLRPFASTNVIGKTVGVGMQSERIELETQIERATRPIGPLIALGAPLEHVGAGRIQVPDEEWRSAIDLLLKQASLIIMLPSSRAGTLQEIALILGSDLIKRTVMIDPPNIDVPKREYDHTIEWARVQAAFTKASFELPDEGRGGALIFFGDRRAPLYKERLDMDAEDRIARLFRRIVKFRNQAGLRRTS